MVGTTKNLLLGVCDNSVAVWKRYKASKETYFHTKMLLYEREFSINKGVLLNYFIYKINLFIFFFCVLIGIYIGIEFVNRNLNCVKENRCD